jgi:lipid II:glycine glycyltransferase (peptidoglycan interpeptide bridge formation enzyme)
MIIELKQKSKEWDQFLKETPHLIIHTPEWKAFIEETFTRTKAKYYAITVKNKIKLIFPTFHTNLSFVPNTSSPFLEYGGPIGTATNQQMSKLKKHLHQNLEIHHSVNNNLLRSFFKVKKANRFVLPLNSEEEMWAHIHKFKRKAVRLAEKSGVVVRDVPQSEINNLYALYLKVMKRFGTSPYSKKYFVNFYKYLVSKKLAKVLGAYYKGKLIAVLAGVTVSGRVHINISISDHKYLKFRPNDALHWAFIQWACNNKYREFDFGIVWEGRGQYGFKKKWNAELKDLDYFYLKPQKLSEPFYFKFKFFPTVWKLMPTSVASILGQFFREQIAI